SKPSLIVQSMIGEFGVYLPNIIRTFTSICMGWAIACLIGIVMGALMANYTLLGTTLTPYINFLCTLPVITLVPMMYVFMGVGREVIVIAIVLQSFAIVILNSSTGFMNVPVMRIELMTSLRATKRQIFSKCMFPSALNSVFTGMKLSAIFATTTCVSAEVNGSNIGLGALVISAKTYVKTDQMFGSILYIAIIGVFFYMLADALEAGFVKWKE
ncbi:MAG: ABC transporter permease subunit, partial [Lachnospiraceae bacterium]